MDFWAGRTHFGQTPLAVREHDEHALVVLRLDRFIESLLLPWPDQPHLNSVENRLFRRRHLDLAFCFHAQSKTKTPALVPSFLLSLYPLAFYSSSRLWNASTDLRLIAIRSKRPLAARETVLKLYFERSLPAKIHEIDFRCYLASIQVCPREGNQHSLM